MSSVPGLIASYLVNSVCQLPLIAAAGWLVSRMLRKLGPGAEHVTWVLTLALSVSTPAIPLLRWLIARCSKPHRATAHSSIALLAAPYSLQHPERIFALPEVLVLPMFVFYLGVLLYFTIRLAWSLHNTVALLRETRSILLTPEQDRTWLQCKRSFSLETVRIRSSRKISGPLTLGFRNPVLLMPASFMTTCTSQDLLAALAHECAHIKRHDFQKNLFYELSSLTLAFHPVAWILKSYIAQTREMVCDGMAIEKVIDSHRYTQSLLRLASMVFTTSQAPTSHAIGIFDASILEKRVIMMNVKKQQCSPAVRYGLIIPTILFLFSVAAGGAAMAVTIEPQSASGGANSESVPAPVYKIGNGVTAPILLSQIDPVYPESARKDKDKFQGTCLIGLVVDRSGTPRDVHITRPLGPDFDANAIKAVQQYRFAPAKRSGEPVAVSLAVEVNFQKY